MSDEYRCIIYGVRWHPFSSFPFSTPAYTVGDGAQWLSADPDYFYNGVRLPTEAIYHCSPTGIFFNHKMYIVARQTDNQVCVRTLDIKSAPLPLANIRSTETIVPCTADSKLHLFHKAGKELLWSVFDSEFQFIETRPTRPPLLTMNEYPSIVPSRDEYNDRYKYKRRLFFQSESGKLASLEIDLEHLTRGADASYENIHISYSPSAVIWRVQDQRFFLVFYHGAGKFLRKLRCACFDTAGGLLGDCPVNDSKGINIHTSPSAILSPDGKHVLVYYADHDNCKLKEVTITVKISLMEFSLKDEEARDIADIEILDANSAPFVVKMARSFDQPLAV
ncbi:MAG: hypothetical protein JWQ21_3046 [Herminiimonas sp.]|nr:hypothetical protein [Herminiimonas sp.]